MSEWQPIETAPRDGTGIIVTDARVMHWTQIVFWDEEVAGPYVWARDDTDNHWHRDMFTHWMPIPDGPVSTSGERGNG